MPTFDYPIRVPAAVLESLGEFTGQLWSDSMALEPFICEAIRNYMRPAPPDEAQQTTQPSLGYQWKQVFLPDGTRLRASFGGQSYFARVEGEEIKYGEHAMSPSRFANLQGSGNRNAWKAVWLLLPGSQEWLLADVCRSARKVAIARLLGDAAPTPRPPQEHTAHRLADRRRSQERRKASAHNPAPQANAPHEPAAQPTISSQSMSRRQRRAAKRLSRKRRQ